MRLVEFDDVWFAPDAVAQVTRWDDAQARVTFASGAPVLMLYLGSHPEDRDNQFARLLALIDPVRLGQPTGGPPPFVVPTITSDLINPDRYPNP